MPYLTAMSQFRDSVREHARELKATEILKLSDRLRDEVLPNLGVRLEDREGSASAVKLVDKETLLKERETKKALEAEKAAEKERKKAEAAVAQAAKDAQKKINPKEMFLHETDKYSAFDDKVYFYKNKSIGCYKCFIWNLFTGYSHVRRQWRGGEQGSNQEAAKTSTGTGEEVQRVSCFSGRNRLEG